MGDELKNDLNAENKDATNIIADSVLSLNMNPDSKPAGMINKAGGDDDNMLKLTDADGNNNPQEDEIDKDMHGNGDINFGSVHPNGKNNELDLRQMQSVMDPS